MLLKIFISFYLVVASLFGSAIAQFGVTESGTDFIVDTDGGLVFTVNAATGDITSLLYNGIQAQTQTGVYSQIASGIGATCTWEQTGNSGNYILITCTATGIIHYYVAQYKSPAVHMATYTTEEPSVGELRYICRLNVETLSDGYEDADVAGGTAIEATDVYLVDGQTRSKFYSSKQFIWDYIKGVGGPDIAAWMIVTETGFSASSGGPFFRDIDNQNSGVQELYFYMNSGHTQTEDDRMGLHGPYALWFTDSTDEPPAQIDTLFWDGLGAEGWLTVAERGIVTGTATGSEFPSNVTLGWSNSDYQYWVQANVDTGAYTSPYMAPGTYTMTMYQIELEVATTTVTVTAGGITVANIESALVTPDNIIWSFGDYDGTPGGFLNADMIETMHPSDTRMHEWPRNITVGLQGDGYVPMAIFQDIAPLRITFGLISSQIADRTLEIATTLAYAGGRPVVQVGDWTSATPAVPDQPDSRGVTRGTWRGNNILYTYTIPSEYLVAEPSLNTIIISVASGSGSLSEFLSPNFIFDMIRLY